MESTAPHITRMDIPDSGTHGWQVRFRRGKKYHSKYFSDNKYGSPAAAYNAALSWRDEELPLQPPPIPPWEASAESRARPVRGLSMWFRKAHYTKTSADRKRRYAMIRLDPIVVGNWRHPDGHYRTVARSVRAHSLRSAIWTILRLRALDLQLRQEDILPLYGKAYRQFQKRILDKEREVRGVRASEFE